MATSDVLGDLILEAGGFDRMFIGTELKSQESTQKISHRCLFNSFRTIY